jgi:hypothetical protein
MREFMLMQGKNAGNPDGLPSILTWQKRKLTIENRGSDNFCHPMRPRQIIESGVARKLTFDGKKGFELSRRSTFQQIN